MPNGERPPPVEVVVLAVVVVAAGVVARFVAAPTPLWLDEALSVNLASLPPAELFSALRHDGHPPLYYLVLHGWMAVVGDGDVAVRSLSGVFAVAALPLTWVVARRRGGPTAAALALVVTAASPYAVRYATETRMYSLVMLEVLVGWLLVDDLLAGRGARWRAPALAATCGALVLTHYWGLFLAGAVGMSVIGSWWRAWGRDRRRDGGEGAAAPASGAAVVAGSLAAGGLAFVPWLGTFSYQAAHTATPWAPAMRPTAVVGAVLADLSVGDLDDATAGGALLGVLALVGLLGRGADTWRIELDLRTRPTVRWPLAVAAATLALGSTAALASGSAFATRYAAAIVPMVLVAVAVGLAEVGQRILRVLLVVALVGFGAVGVADQMTTERTQAVAWADAVAGARDPVDGATVVYCPDQLGPAGDRLVRSTIGDVGGPAEHLSGPGVRQITFPASGDPRLVDWVDYRERNAAADPAAFADELVADTPAGRPIVLVWNPNYRTYEGRCEGLRAALGALRPGAVDPVAADGDEHYEHATVTVFPPAQAS